MAFGFEFATVIVACVIGGYWLDERLGSAPVFILLFTVAGMAGAIYRLLWSLKNLR